MNIAVVGTGYVGLVTGTCFAEFGVNVVGVDKDEAKIASLQKGRYPSSSRASRSWSSVTSARSAWPSRPT